MEAQTLRPQKNAIEIKGKFSYSEGIRAWNIIRFKKELINEFPQLKEKRSAFSYKMTFYQEYKELEKAIRKIKRDGGALPVLLFLCKEKIVER